MWVAQKVICIFYHLRFGTSALFSAKAMTSCKLANTKYATTEQQAPCHLPGTKPSPPPPADLSPRARHSLTALLLCSERPDALRLLPSNFPFFFNSPLRIFWRSDALQKPTKIARRVFASPSVLCPRLWGTALMTPGPPSPVSVSGWHLLACLPSTW